MKHFEVSLTTDHAYKRWRINQEITPEMRGFMDSVAELLDAGMSGWEDIYAAIIPQFDFSEEELLRDKWHTEGGTIGTDIHCARHRVELERYSARESEAGKRLNLSPGQKLGPIIFDSRTAMIRNTCVVQIDHENGEVIVEGTAGRWRKRYSTTFLGIEAGIRNAAERISAKSDIVPTGIHRR